MTANDTSSSGNLSAERKRSRAALVGAFQTRTIEESAPELLPYIGPGMSVLDIGCGPGSITMGVANVVTPGEVIGTDPSGYSIDEASRNARDAGIENVKFEVDTTGWGNRIDFPDNTFDVVYCNTVMHFFIDPIHVLKEMKRITKNGGWVITSGVRDWGFSPRYPECPHVDAVWNAYVKYNDSLREHYNAGGDVAVPQDRATPELSYIDLQTGRKCSEWFTEAGFTDLTMELKVQNWRGLGTEPLEPIMLDIVPKPGDAESQWLDAQQDIIDAGLLTDNMIKLAQQELAAWYANPHAFYYYAVLLVASRA
jgi:ubiquinone/menaquinone biosynthesis C-methylase UbiE